MKLPLQIIFLWFPLNLPLNVQISFCYSRFLDVHLYNKFSPSLPTYSPYTTLAWKDMNSFCYQPSTSNKHPRYKDAVVPNTLHRIEHRCTEDKDKSHHKNFIYKILQHRSQEMHRVKQCFRRFKAKHKVQNKSCKDTSKLKRGYSLTYCMDRIFKKQGDLA